MSYKNGIKSFFHSCLKRKEGNHVSKEEVFQSYQNYCVWNRFDACKKVHFFRTLYQSVPNMRPKLKMRDDKLVYCLVDWDLAIPKESVYMDEFMKALGQAFHVAVKDPSNTIDLWGNFNGKDIVIVVRQANAQDIAKRDIVMKNKSMEAVDEKKADPLDNGDKDI